MELRNNSENKSKKCFEFEVRNKKRQNKICANFLDATKINLCYVINVLFYNYFLIIETLLELFPSSQSILLLFGGGTVAEKSKSMQLWEKINPKDQRSTTWPGQEKDNM